MSRIVPLFLMLLSGCARYIEVQSQLIQQTRRGVSELQASLEQKSQIVRQHHALQRKRLDDAFDADVRARETFESDWIIEHRRAYAAAVDALSAARFASERANEIDARNVAAIDAALDRLQWLQSIQLRFNPFTEGSDDEHN